jgi:signal transduction histidine kinase
MGKLTTFLNEQTKLFFIFSGILLVLFISFVDLITKDFFVLELYVIPVIFAAWFAGRYAGFFMAFVSGIATFIIDIIETAHHSSPLVHYWNLIMNFSFFMVMAYFVSVLKESMELKSKFTSMVSHELRTPIAVIQEGVSIVRDGLVGDINDRQKELLSAVGLSTRRLTRIINDILDFQKYEAGKMKMVLEENDMNKTIQEAYGGVELLVKEKGLDFIFNMGEDLPEIKFDKDRIIQVIVNLLSNAIKFTDKGSITVSTAKNNDSIQVAVRDTGFGIKPADMPKLFKSFGQVGSPNKHGEKGTGLGLAVSKEIVVNHGGKMWAESEFGKGTTFYFTLPVRQW